MADEKIVDAEVVTDAPVSPEAQAQGEQITIDLGTAFNLKLQEFDKKIAEAELSVATLKRDKSSYIYDENVKQIVAAHRERLVKSQIEEETKKKLAETQK